MLADKPLAGDTDWPYYNGRIDGARYSGLDEINEQNVGQMREHCRLRLSDAGPLSTAPILVDGILYLTVRNATLAVNPATCEIIWKSLYAPEEQNIYAANRGVAYLDGRVFRGTGDGRLIAYEAATGRELWRRKVGDPARHEYVSGAPLAWKGRVFVGLAGGDFGVIGRIMAFDVQTGHPLWSFNTVPQAGEFGNATWPGDTAKRGGGGTWSSFTLDPQTGELFVPVANPAPDAGAAKRGGDKLFTNSVLVLDSATGQRRWHFQARQNDTHDYGISPPPILLDMAGRKVVAAGSKDGFLYLIDRTTHGLIWKTPVTTIFNHSVFPTLEGVRICPGVRGGFSYNSPAYDPGTKLLIAGSVDWCSNLRAKIPQHDSKAAPARSGDAPPEEDSGTGWIVGIDATTGKVKWRLRTVAPVISGITPTASGLTFAGDIGGTLFVLRSRDGAVLRRIQTAGPLAGGIITYRSQGRQYLAVTSGNVSRTAWGTVGGDPTLVIYGLPESAAAPQTGLALAAPNVAHGREVYAGVCSACHGPSGEGGQGPALKGIAGRYSSSQVAELIAAPKGVMPKLYPTVLKAQDVADVAAYIYTLPTR